MSIDNENSSVGTDSFLDVITNFVGILIILVMVVGERAKHFPPPNDVEASADTELEAGHAEAAALETDVQHIAVQMQRVQGELAARTMERDRVQTLITAIEGQLAERRAALDEASRGQYDVARERALAEDELARLDKERQAAEETAAPETITIESYPTPIGKTVSGKEAHFQLLGGRLTFVPFEALIDRLQVTVQEYANKQSLSGDIIDSLGPIGGFRMRYLVERHDRYLTVAQVELLPTSAQLGEPIDAALQAKSEFRDKLGMMSPRQYTITVWTYPDSFSEFRRLKKELYEMGYAVAGRPLPEGMPIGASPHGSRSSAE